MSTATQAVGSSRGRDWPKHLFIGIVLAVELLPLYMMWQISFKDNTGFIQNPWFPSNPIDWKWGNYVHAAKLVLPYVANINKFATELRNSNGVFKYMTNDPIMGSQDDGTGLNLIGKALSQVKLTDNIKREKYDISYLHK